MERKIDTKEGGGEVQELAEYTASAENTENVLYKGSKYKTVWD